MPRSPEPPDSAPARGLTILGPSPLLRAEALAVLALACAVYRNMGAPWLMFGLLFLAPNFSMVGYLANRRAGAWVYNAADTYIAPLIIAGVCYFGHMPALLPICVIWVAQIGFDRALGYGLKYETNFKDTHLGRV
jgi:Domain of unknown function (DUF4260)